LKIFQNAILSYPELFLSFVGVRPAETELKSATQKAKLNIDDQVNRLLPIEKIINRQAAIFNRSQEMSNGAIRQIFSYKRRAL
jgi:hypothetical protein